MEELLPQNPQEWNALFGILLTTFVVAEVFLSEGLKKFLRRT